MLTRANVYSSTVEEQQQHQQQQHLPNQQSSNNDGKHLAVPGKASGKKKILFFKRAYKTVHRAEVDSQLCTWIFLVLCCFPRKEKKTVKWTHKKVQFSGKVAIIRVSHDWKRWLFSLLFSSKWLNLWVFFVTNLQNNKFLKHFVRDLKTFKTEQNIVSPPTFASYICYNHLLSAYRSLCNACFCCISNHVQHFRRQTSPW